MCRPERTRAVGGGLTQVLDRRAHLSHTDHVGDRADGRNDTSERVGVLFSELFEQDDAELGQKRVFLALLDDESEPASQVCSLLTDLGALVVQTPQDGRDDLGQVRLDADSCEGETSNIVSRRDRAR